MQTAFKNQTIAILSLAILVGIQPSVTPAQLAVTTANGPIEINADLLNGQWRGKWMSCKSGHNGRLKATFCRINKTQVEAKFTGSFAKIFPFRYRATLDIIREEEGLIQLRGSRKLGPLMGTFTYQATITANQFRATYRSKRDCGQWNMDRVACDGH